MTIILDATNPRAVKVENYNDGETIIVTPILARAIEEATASAAAHEAVVRVIAGDGLSSISITTSPRALRLKMHLLQFAVLLLRHTVGMPGLVKLLDDVAQR